jgi:hypothetical protein
MSVEAGRTRLSGAMKELLVRWDKAKMSWRDPVSEDLERTLIGPLEPKVRAAATAMAELAEMINAAKRECG